MTWLALAKDPKNVLIFLLCSLLPLSWFYSGHVRETAVRAEYTLAALEQTNDLIDEVNQDTKTNQAAAAVVETKIKYVDRVVYETVTETIDSDCNVDQLNGLLNLAVSAVNDTMQLRPE